jgi:3-(methylthio)propanoyl-CoA dehydrogenase
VLIGERQRGLVPYVATLMNGARIGIAAQSMGIAEAAYRIARDYAASRKQFGVAIEKLPAVRDMMIEMKIALETGRALLYDTSRVVDLALGYNSQYENNPPQDKAAQKQLKDKARVYKRFAGMLTPMSKYYCSEMCNRVAYDAIQVLGGSGYMRDYASERHARDARITTIYEGTSQLQIVAAVRGVCSGTAEKYFAELAALQYDPQVSDLLARLVEGVQQLQAAIEFTKEQGNEYMDLRGRELVDVAIDLINGYLLCGQASTKVEMNVPVAGNGAARNGQTISMKERKLMMARRFVEKNAPKIKALTDLIRQGDKSTFSEYEALVGPVPEQ